MAAQTTKKAVEDARERIEAGKAKINSIRKAAGEVRPELETTVQEAGDALNAAITFVDSVAQELGWWPPVRRLIRRLVSREFIISVVAIIAILVGDLGAQEAIAIAVAGSGLAIGRGVAKARVGGSDT